MVADYETDLARVLDGLRADQVVDAAALARLPLDVRGFGPIKAASAGEGEMKWQGLLRRLRQAEPVAVTAE